ncbi:DUF3298 and DUF4163 domain-containing protein [Psychrobacter aquaticus]|uniref:Putative lipoprotein n=1 Tax=Psychrobacter aquaticus CMS 56 TaxID=1354303 RepID=U4T3J2_9GAMM|nr:DUF3298 and DUF4163 domain-containing protein [Psychrobacter aquaticus]ERL55355.1 putative lipoprotein [Psychrobacter aquaticus CMS 56]
MDAANQSDINKPLMATHLSMRGRHMRLMKLVASSLLAFAVSMTANANSVISTTTYLEYQLPENIQRVCTERENCPMVDVKYLKTNHDWINNIINTRINYFVVNSQPTESAPIKKKNTQADVKSAIDNFIHSQFIEQPEDRQWPYELIVTPNYLGHVNDFELFEIDSYSYTGGAHGMSYNEYFIFDLTTKTQVKLDDMLIVGQKPRFKALAYDAYKTWVKTVDDDVSSYEKNWPFTLSDNVTLTDKGINIRYQHYSIGPYAYGMPMLSIPYSKLEGVIKPRFIPK